jgi:hypothetical protein
LPLLRGTQNSLRQFAIYLSRKVFSGNPNEMSLRGMKQSPIVGGDCFGKNALAMTFAKKAERTYLEDYNNPPTWCVRRFANPKETQWWRDDFSCGGEWSWIDSTLNQ